jgi:hypothetical protein
MEYYLSHPDRNVKTYFNKIQTEWTQSFNRNRRKFQNTKGPKTVWFAMSWKMNFIFSLNAREIPIIETFYTNTFKIYIQIFLN